MIQRLVFSLALVTAAQGGEVLLNPGFESGALSPWFEGRNFGGLDWSITSTNCNSGSFCATNNGNIELEQTFSSVPVGSISDISFWAMHPDPTVTAIAVDFFYADGGDDEFLVNTTGTSWNFFDVFVDLRPSGSLDGISIWGNGGGVTVLDDASIQDPPGPSTPEPASAALLLGGFAVLGIVRRHRRA